MLLLIQLFCFAVDLILRQRKRRQLGDLGDLGLFRQRHVVAAGKVLHFLQFPHQLCHNIQRCGAFFFHFRYAALQILQPQAVGVLNFARFVRGSLHQLGCLLGSLLTRQLFNGFGFGIGVLQHTVRLRLCLAADDIAVIMRPGNDGVAILLQLLAGIVVRASLDAQRGGGIGSFFCQLRVFPHKVVVFQPQHGDLVAQGMVALLHLVVARFPVDLFAVQLVRLGCQRGILRGQALRLPQQGLAAAAQRVRLGAAFLLLFFGIRQGLLVGSAKLTHRAAHIVRLIAAKACLAHCAFF